MGAVKNKLIEFIETKVSGIEDTEKRHAEFDRLMNDFLNRESTIEQEFWDSVKAEKMW